MEFKNDFEENWDISKLMSETNEHVKIEALESMQRKDFSKMITKTEMWEFSISKELWMQQNKSWIGSKKSVQRGDQITDRVRRLPLNIRHLIAKK